MKYFLLIPILALSLLLSSDLVAQNELKKANKQYELGAYNLATRSYLAIIQKEPKNGEALAKLANSYRYLNNMDEAAKWYRKAIQISGVDPIHIFEFANVLKAQGDYKRAREWFGIYAEGQLLTGKQYMESCDFAESILDVASQYKISNEFANSPESDFGPAFYNNQVVYSSARQDIKQLNKLSEHNWEGGAKNQLFLSSIDQNNFLGRPAYLRSNIKSNFNEGPVSYSADGRVVAFTKNNFNNGTRQIPGSGMELSIYIADVTNEGDWDNARAFPYNGSGYSSGFPYLSADGKTLYFSSNRPDGFGGYDIYVSYYIGTSWSTPENMGPVVNSPGNEITPAMIGSDLFFASDWHHGLGGFDIFRAERQKGIWKNVYHLGNGINSSYDDYGYTYDKELKRGYIVSNRPGGKGKEDIYRIVKTAENLLIFVTDQTTGDPIPNAIVDFTACGESVFTTNTRGEYYFKVLNGMNCDILISKKGYRSYNFNLNANAEAAQSFEVQLVAEAVVNVDVNDYLGKIVDATTNKSVASVRIKATDQISNLVIETSSDDRGDYRLPLDPGRDYLIRYSKAGYLDIHQQVDTKNSADKSVLGVVSFPPAGTNTVNSTPPANNGNGLASNDARIEEPVEIVEVVTTTTTVTTPAPPPPPVDEMAIATQKGFSVQLAAVPDGQSVQVNKYTGMSTAGNIYGRNEGVYKKVRVGIFATRAEAQEAQAQAKLNGFKSAFIVKEEISSLRDLEIYREAMNAPTPAPAVPTTRTIPPKTTSTTSRPPAETGNIKVQIASYKNMKFFNRATAAKLGKVETRKKGDFTIILLAGFNNQQSAESARRAAIQAGYKGAYLVKETNGVLEKVE